jgi:hypothetical protein
MANVPICVCNFIPIQVSSKTNRIIMWTEGKLMEAAQEWADGCNPNNENWHLNSNWDIEERAYYSFLAGAKFIINNTQV